MEAELNQALKETREKLLTAHDALSEERIRAIVREELAAWEKRIVQIQRFGVPLKAEVK